ncbi:riboflavin synthase [Rufibacter glacialis]|uniref:Riboflavin synthase n=1 Tax=Rufibacter glacialis TaxID=1259555 RepID=A0A5M8QGK7_9BACT|nr:riboflavin synthase [Rufibacter glacialis]KAA6434281.1 riboflavin synthase [Rufibacter glacialis]GGK68252.1 riboflavin synthase subunit alpha [Rufibacter glacialis]
MFTGIIEAQAEVVSIIEEQANRHFTFTCPFTHELKIDQSVAHNGVCLTVVGLQEERYTVTAIAETLSRTNLGQLKAGDKVNLERCLLANSRYDGHIVQGHVDQVGICEEVKDQQGSWLFRFSYQPQSAGHMTVEKGSICINGISLTVVESGDDFFSVAIIPYTYEFTNLHAVKPGDQVNLEFDIIGKYVARLLQK